MTANHADGCPAIADVRDGCSCLLRGAAAQGDYPHEDPCDCDDCRRHAVAELTRLGQQQDHLPECSANEARLVPGAVTGQQGTGYPVDYGTTVLGIGYGPCICDRLRACEARVGGLRLDNLREGYGQGLDAATEAVEGLPDARYEHWVRRDDALAAIAALKSTP